MDELDLAILREVSRHRVLWWGSLDPRLSAGDIADRLGLDRTTVWSRLRSWERQ
ncbi:MAG TPA: AsnC family transcriptional regulator [Thermoplasmata archaeon]|nr:AsnC family transcriptional regulator [Thermoplasmata archaeon]